MNLNLLDPTAGAVLAANLFAALAVLHRLAGRPMRRRAVAVSGTSRQSYRTGRAVIAGDGAALDLGRLDPTVVLLPGPTDAAASWPLWRSGADWTTTVGAATWAGAR